MIEYPPEYELDIRDYQLCESLGERYDFMYYWTCQQKLGWLDKSVETLNKEKKDVCTTK